MSNKTLVLVRHAHRDTSLRQLDNGLSEKGRKQAHDLVGEVKAKLGSGIRPVIWTSAKMRCRETLEPLAQDLGIPIQEHPLLLEQAYHETETQFLNRITAFFEEWKASSEPLIIACSHGDLLPILIEKITGTQKDLYKGEWIIVTGESDEKK